MKLITLLVLAVLLASCEGPPHTIDQCLRAQLFDKCMQALPAGPQTTHYNDWSEVVNSCSLHAQYASYRLREHVKPECRS